MNNLVVAKFAGSVENTLSRELKLDARGAYTVAVTKEFAIATNWRPKKHATLVYLLRESSVLLIHKLSGHGSGRVNAPGGRLEENESIYQCAVREVREEVGIQVVSLSPAAALRFYDIGNGFSMAGYVFTSRAFEGDAVSSNEAKPFWCGLDEIPYQEMWEDDALWLPQVLAGDCIHGDFIFENDCLRSHDVGRVDQTEILQYLEGRLIGAKGER